MTLTTPGCDWVYLLPVQKGYISWAAQMTPIHRLAFFIESHDSMSAHLSDNVRRSSPISGLFFLSCE